MYDVNASNAADFDFTASDGTKLTFSKITSKDNIQVKFPEDHDLADGQGNGLIFRRDGSHYKDNYDVTVSATRKVAPAPAPTPLPTAGTAPVADALAPTPTNPFDKYSDDQLDGLKVVIRGKLYTLEAESDNDILVLAA